MRYKPFPRCTPEEVGIPSSSVLQLLDNLEGDYTEIHSLMIMRHGKIAAEGWWNPYTPGLRHTMMSVSKTFSGTAIGIAAREGLLSLDERIVDIFPEEVPYNAEENLRNVTIRHLLMMGCGVEYENPVNKTWVHDFFRLPFPHKPGTTFLYNNAPATLLAAILERKSGQPMMEWLKPRLFDIIGIDCNRNTWFHAPDGTTFAPGGLHARTEDILRLMKLYLNGGVWEEKRILDEDYVRSATRIQIDTASIGLGPKSDNIHGYGYMMWMGHIPGTYRAEGANGQFGVVIPDLDMIIAITQSSPESPVSQKTLDHLWAFLSEIDPPVANLPQSRDSCVLANRLSRLAIPAEPFSPFGSFPMEGIMYRKEGEGVHPESLFYDPIHASDEADHITGLTEFAFSADPHRFIVRMDAVINGKMYHFDIPTDGSRALAELPEIYVSIVALSGYWKDDLTFSVRFRWMETVFVNEMDFCFFDNGCTVSVSSLRGIDPARHEPKQFAAGGNEP